MTHNIVWMKTAHRER